MIDRTAARAHMRAIRKAHVAALGQEAITKEWAALAARALPHLANFASVGSYHAMGSEVDPASLEAILRLRGQIIALPIVIDAQSSLHFAQHDLADDLTPGPMGDIPQPLGSAHRMLPGALLVPLLAADARGYRLGQGAGHYDRTIAALKPVFTLGLAYDCQIVPQVQDEAWDEPLDAIVTPTRWIACHK
jgi:5-formyltetrahydrofolate cyclo-ligase